MKPEIKKGSRRLREFRISYSHAFYLVTTAKAEGAARLDNPASFVLIVSELTRMEQESIWEVPALVVMPTHLHLIARLGWDQDLSRALQLFKGRTARKINEKNRTSGSIWYKGFHDRLIRETEKMAGYYYYLLLNPVKENLCAAPADYPYFRIKPEINDLL